MPAWLTIAKSYIGMREIPGIGHNPSILDWLRRYALNIGKWGKSRDETPWCAVFVSHCLEEAGHPSTKDARARLYATYGRASKPNQGAIIVIRRRRGPNRTGSNSGGFHVGFLDKMTRNFYWIVGGNQRNSVSRAAYSKKNYELVALRWPVE